MAKCPSCGSDVATSLKEWDVNPPRGKGFHVKLYECPGCGKKFREIVK
ncbi:MAG: chorismate-binding protein [Candidatus Bathyarchaeia archaeon]